MKHLHWYYKFLIIFLIFFSMFFLLTKNMSKVVESSQYKNYVNFINIPFNFLNKYNIFNYKNLLKEKEKLEKHVLVITLNEQETKNNEQELKELKNLLKIKDLYTDYKKIYAKPVSRNKLYWFSTIIIDKGSKDGIKENSIVVTKDGLIGTIKSVTKDYSTIKLITNNDIENKISVGVKTKDSFKHGTIIDYKYPYLKVELTTDKTGINIGDTLITSGLGNLPKNIEIGTIQKIEKDKYELTYILEVKPNQDMNNISYVSVLVK